MPNLHIVIGDANARKSSLVRCLSGVGSGRATRYMDIADASGAVTTVYCMLSALQENYRPQTPAEFIAFVKALRPHPTDVLLTLRASSRGRYPGALTYISAFRAARWPIVNVALLGSAAAAHASAFSVSKVCSVPASPGRPTNESAAQVRRAWGWK